MNSRQSPLIEIETPIHRPGVDLKVNFWIQERPFRTHINLRGNPEEQACAEAVTQVIGIPLPRDPNTCACKDDWSICWLAPDEWLVIGPQGEDKTPVLADQLAPLHHALTDISGGQTVLRVGGSAFRDVLASACPLDLHSRVFGEGACAQTVIAHANVVFICVSDDPRGEALDIVVRRSFADHLVRWLMDAAAEGGFELLSPVLDR